MKKPEARPITASPVRWGIMGTAAIARSAYLPAFADSKANTVRAVASRDHDRARKFAEEFSIPRAYGSYDELLADSEIEAIYLPLPVSMHAKWSLRAAAAGKAVLVEKPMARNAPEAGSMAEAFATKGLLLAEAMMYGYHPLNRKALQLVRAGAVGEVRMARASFNAAVSDSRDIRLRKETGGGAMLDVGCYCVSILRAVSGQEPCEVTALARWGKVDENLAAILSFPSGMIGYLGCGLKTQFDCSYEISGDQGRILVGRAAMCAWPGESFAIELYQGDEKQTITIQPANPYKLLLEDFARALRSGTRMQHGIEDAIKNMQAINEILAAAVAAR